MNTVLFVMMMCKASGIHSPCPTDCCGYLYRQLLCTETLMYSVVTLCCCEVLKKQLTGIKCRVILSKYFSKVYNYLNNCMRNLK